MKSILKIITTPVIVHNLIYSCVTFKTIEAANGFMTDNADWGLLHEENDKLYVARLKDKGKSLNTENEEDFYQEFEIFYSPDYYKNELRFDFICKSGRYVNTRTFLGISEEEGNTILTNWSKKFMGVWEFIR